MDLQDRTRLIFEALITGGDFELAAELIDPAYSDPRGPSGVDGFIGGLKAVRQAFPDWSSTVEESIVQGDTVAARWTVRGTQRGDFMGIPATGRTIEMQECGFLSFREGRLLEIRRVADELTLLRQLGAIPGQQP